MREIRIRPLPEHIPFRRGQNFQCPDSRVRRVLGIDSKTGKVILRSAWAAPLDPPGGFRLFECPIDLLVNN